MSMETQRINYSDLISFTDTYRLLFVPYILLHEKTVYEQLYDTELHKAIVNAYPRWEGNQEDILKGYVYLVLDKTKLKDIRQLRYMYTDNECVSSIHYPELIGGAPGQKDADDLMVVEFKLPVDLCHRFVDGNYSELFNKEELRKAIDAFVVNKRGIITTVTEDVTLRISKDYHILMRTNLYEKVQAAQFGVPYDKFKGRLKELKEPIDLRDEELNLDLLIKQLRSNGW